MGPFRSVVRSSSARVLAAFRKSLLMLTPVLRMSYSGLVGKGIRLFRREVWQATAGSVVADLAEWVELVVRQRVGNSVAGLGDFVEA